MARSHLFSNSVSLYDLHWKVNPDAGLASNPAQGFEVSDKVQIADKPHEKLIPKDGQELTLKELLNDYKTPFIDAYERSKHLKDGELGKSKTLEEIVDRLKDCPWADQIRIQFDSST